MADVRNLNVIPLPRRLAKRVIEKEHYLHSTPRGKRPFPELCTNREWRPKQKYLEEGRSAHSECIAKRPVFRQLLEDAAKDEFDIVVVHTLDRWARNLKVSELPS